MFLLRASAHPREAFFVSWDVISYETRKPPERQLWGLSFLLRRIFSHSLASHVLFYFWQNINIYTSISNDILSLNRILHSTKKHIPQERNVTKEKAGDGNRTHVSSLEGWCSTIELHPHDKLWNCNAQNRNRTSDTRIFSPLLYQLSYLGILRNPVILMFAFVFCSATCVIILESLLNVNCFFYFSKFFQKLFQLAVPAAQPTSTSSSPNFP